MRAAFITYAALAVILTGPAFATDKPTPPVTPPANPVQNFFANLEARAAANQAQKQAQQQAQAQQQGQGQTQTATGGNANNSNSVNVDNRTRIVNAPPVYGNGDTYGVSGGIEGFAFAAVVPSRAHGRGKIGDNIARLSPNRAILYTQCGLPHTDQTFDIMDIRCDLHGAALRRHEAQYAAKTVVHKPAPQKPVGKPRHRVHKKGCGC